MKKIIFIITFFVFSGYYAGLAIMFSFNLKEFSQYYSVTLRVILAILMIIVIKSNWHNFKNNKNSIYLFLFSIFWSFYAFKVLYTENITFNNELGRVWYEYIFYAITFVVIPFYAFFSINFDKFKSTILDSFIFSGFVLGVISTYLYGRLLTQGIGRLNLITYQTGEDVLNPLSLSYSGALTIVLCIFRLSIIKEKNLATRIYLLATIVFSFIMFLLGSSRGSVVALLLTFPLFIYYSPVKQKIKLMVISLLSIPIVIWAIEASGSNIFERISNTSEDQGGGRASLWSKALEHFYENPIIGGKIEIGGIYPHNVIIEILMSTGIIGAIIILPILFKGMKLSFQHANLDKNNLFVSLILIQGFVLHFFTAGFYTATLLFVPIALTFSIALSSNKSL